MKRLVQGELIETNRYIITFAGTKIPNLIKLADWHHEIVQQYIPNPISCNNCQKFGHTKKWCRKADEICAWCGGAGHKANYCSAELRCSNCSGAHSANYFRGDAYLFRCEIEATMAREYITRLEATEKVRDTFREEMKSYRFTVHKGN